MTTGTPTRSDENQRGVHPPPPPESSNEASPPRIPVVGIGASAGGLNALQEFFAGMPADSGMAFVVVTHCSPGTPSVLPERLGLETDMPVVEVSVPTRLEADHVYTVRPGYEVSVRGGVLHPEPVRTRTGAPTPIDHFFQSLARDQHELALAVLLSGLGSDGSHGIESIKDECGIVMVQDEQPPAYAGPPPSAIAPRLLDYVLPVRDMPGHLLAYAHVLSGGGTEAERTDLSAAALQRILVLLHDRTGQDFSQYKPTTVSRRIARRVAVLRLESVASYIRYLDNTPEEAPRLLQELLIGVTSFFRDAEVWDALVQPLTALLDEKPDGSVFRAWVPGCSTGEEAYTLAILLREYLDRTKRTLRTQIYATDLDGLAVATARVGAYPFSVTRDLSPPRLARFFTQEGAVVVVKQELRDMLVFASQNIVTDPPFTRLDLLSCRNLLIYLDSNLHRRLLPLFHYSLKPHGLLLLGASETIGHHLDLFDVVDKKAKLFRHNHLAPSALAAQLPAATSDLSFRGTASTMPLPRSSDALRQVVERALLTALVPPTVLVREHGEVVHIHGRTGLFLEPAPGSQTVANIFKMARLGLQSSLFAAIHQAGACDDEVSIRGVPVHSDMGVLKFDLRVRRLTQPEALRGLYRITFQQLEAPQPSNSAVDRGEPPGRVDELERELQYSRDTHQETIEELEATNEELRSTNEELQSVNEELQSANEELETSKEEMQTLNEELHTVNAELQGKVDELSRANNDMKNLLNGTDIATVFLDKELRIKSFARQARHVIPLIPSDVGRPIGDLVSTLQYDRLVADAQGVLKTLIVKEAEIRGENETWYLARILPYRTLENVVEGLVLTFVDVTKVKALVSEQALLHEVLRKSLASLLIQDRDLRIVWAGNPLFGRAPAELVGKTDDDIFPPEDRRALFELEQTVLNSGEPARHRVVLDFQGRTHSYELYLEPNQNRAGSIDGISCLIIDVSRWGFA